MWGRGRRGPVVGIDKEPSGQAGVEDGLPGTGQ